MSSQCSKLISPITCLTARNYGLAGVFNACFCSGQAGVSGSAEEKEGLLCNIGFDQVSGNLEGLKACAGKPRCAKLDMFAYSSEVLHAMPHAYTCNPAVFGSCSIIGYTDLLYNKRVAASNCQEPCRSLSLLRMCTTHCLHDHTLGMCRQQS